ncbi:Hol1p [Sugiyamaella lignohabitans]|uniref:Hol1p n=1 Tax=Sugiyamaella lignohabitans TaxID=796027 RepID=A0A167CRF0_9ASCO|nr:Hol1p [Sugiyamaella lignohabitans]ANB12019.1 Hol1p [Sugiyamaella lignohabitans]
MPETKWERGRKADVIQVSNEKETTSTIEDSSSVSKPGAEVSDNQAGTYMLDDFLYKGRPHRRQFGLLFHNKEESIFSILKLFWIPVKLCSYPIIVWASIVYSGCASLFLMINMTQSANFAAPPYNFSPSAVGYTNFAVLGGLVIGLFTAGPFSDWICKFSTKRNGNVREPEMRLPALIPFAIIATVGTVIITVGYTQKWDWPVIVILGYGCIGLQTSSIMGIVSTYAVDGYVNASGSIFVLASIFKDVYGYGVSKYLPPMIPEKGYTTSIMVVYAVAIGPLALAVVMYFIGKPLRRLSRNSSVHHM